MTAGLNLWEDQNNHQFSKVEEIENNIITDPKLVPNGLNHVQHQFPDNNNVESEIESEIESEPEIEENLEESKEPVTLEKEINKKLQEAIENNNQNEEINDVIKLNNKKRNNTYAAQLLSKYTNNKLESEVENVNSVECQRSNLNCILADFSRLFPLSIIILLLIFIILLVVCMQA
jgi:hypothetical protein